MKRKRLIALIMAIAILCAGIPTVSPLQVLAAGEDDNKIAQFVADNHVLMLRADGRLLGWGDNTYGQLGLGDEAEIQFNKPVEIDFFADKAPIKQLAVTQDSSYALLTNGDLYVAGKGDNGRLGVSDTNGRKTWTLVQTTAKFSKLHINSSAEFAVAEAFDGGLYAWGKNSNGQCGNNSVVNVFVPTLIKPDANVKTLWVGVDYVMYVDLDNNLYGWGNISGVSAGLLGSYTKTDKSHVHWCGGDITSPTSNNSTQTYNVQNKLVPTVLSQSSYTLPASGADSAAPAHGNTETVYLYYRWANEGNYAATFTNHPATYCGAKHMVVNVLGGSQTQVTCSANQGGYNILEFTVTAHNTSAAHNWSEYARAFSATQMVNIKNNLGAVMTGTGHSITNLNGKYYGWGDAAKAQLGPLGSSSEPQELAFLNSLITSRKQTDNVDLLGLDVIRNTMFARFSDGKVYTWGDNTYNKAGVDGAPIKISNPTIVATLTGKNIISIVSGRDTTYYIEASGKIYVSGSNLKGQAGLGPEYNSTATINTPTENPHVKFSFTAPPPKAPGKVDVPTETEAGKTINIKWDSVPDAESYELTREVTYSSGEIKTFVSEEGGEGKVGAASVGQQVIYKDSATEYVDTASPDWESVNYSVRALNYVGDYSPSAGSGSVMIKIPTTPQPTDTTPPTIDITTNAANKSVTIIANDNESGMDGIYINEEKVGTYVYIYTITPGQAIAIYAKDKAGNKSPIKLLTYEQVTGGAVIDPGGDDDDDKPSNGGGGMTNEQLLAIIAALKGSGGMSSSDLAALLAALKSGNGGMSSTDLAALLAALKSGNTPIVGNSGGLTTAELAAILGVGSDNITGNTGSLSPDLLAMLLTGSGSGGGQTTGTEQVLLSSLLEMVTSTSAGGPRENNINITLPGELVQLMGGNRSSDTPIYVLITILFMLLLMIGIYLLFGKRLMLATAPAGTGNPNGPKATAPAEVRRERQGQNRNAHESSSPDYGFGFVDRSRYRGTRFADIPDHFGNSEDAKPDVPQVDNPVTQALAQAWPESPVDATPTGATEAPEELPSITYYVEDEAQEAPQEAEQSSAEGSAEVVPPITYTEDGVPGNPVEVKTAGRRGRKRKERFEVTIPDTAPAAESPTAEPEYAFDAGSLISNADIQDFIVE